MKDIVKSTIVLLIITSIAAALLGVVESVTRLPIQEQKDKTEAAAMQEVLPNAKTFELDNTAELTGTIASVNVGKDDSGNICGYVINVKPNGFGGVVDTMVGISDEGIQGLKVLSHAETPGLGAKSTEPAFYEQFKGKKQSPLKVIKAGTPAEDEIQAITSATITSQAVIDGANEAYDWFLKNGGAE